jgi:predicted dehydrogenase
MVTDRERPLRVGLIGYGLAGSVFHAPLIAATPGLELAAVVTRDPERRASLRARHPGAAALDAPDDLWARREDLDLAVVATPNRSHVPLARAALQAGLPVVVDKPFAPTAAEARDVAAEARGRGLLCTAFQNRRWDGDFLTVRRLVGEGALGAVRRFESRIDRWAQASRAAWKERPEPEEAGGLLFDLGAHLVDQALQLFGPAATVYAELDRRRPGAMVDDDTFVALTHASGVRSHLWMSKVAAQRGPRFRVLGERAAFVKFGADPQEAALGAGGVPGSPGWGEDPPERFGLLGLEGAERAVRTEAGSYQRFYALVAAALRGEGPAPVDLAGVIAALEVIEAARRSAETGATQALAR